MNSLKERFEEIMDDLKGRVRNPLILSFILVWVYYHWRILYILFTIDSKLPIENRLKILTEYINAEHWGGMIGKPLLFSFIGLFVFYLIAIVAQLLKIYVGKKLYAFILSRIDPASFVPRAEFEIEKKRSNSLKVQLEKTEKENLSLTEFKSQTEGRYKSYEDKLNGLLTNVNSNEYLKENFEKTLLVLLGKDLGIQDPNLYRGEIVAQPFGVTNGTWNITSSNMLGQKGSGEMQHLTFEGEVALDYEGKDYGKLSDFKFDTKSYIMSFTLTEKERNITNRFNLIRISSDEFTGFKNKQQYCHFKRKTENFN